MERESARISVNKLGEYLTAPAGRRRTILQDQKEPRAFKAARYTDAYDAIARFMTAGMSDDEMLLNRAQELAGGGGDSTWVDQDRQLSAEVIESFLDLAEDIDLGDFSVLSGQQFETSSLAIEGVNINVRPEFHLVRENDDGTRVFGGIKLAFTKTYPLGKVGCEYVATVLRQYLEGAVEGEVDYRRCIVVDVPSRLVVPAPRAYRRRMSDVQAACQEIAVRWNSV